MNSNFIDSYSNQLEETRNDTTLETIPENSVPTKISTNLLEQNRRGANGIHHSQGSKFSSQSLNVHQS